MADLDRATLIEALNASKLSKSSDIAQLVGQLGGVMRQASTDLSDARNAAAQAGTENAQIFTKELIGKIGAGAEGLRQAFVDVGGKTLDMKLRISDLTAAGGNLLTTFTGSVLGFDNLSKIVGVSVQGLTALAQYVEKNVDVWKDLSGVGASFGNDAVAMDVALKRMRLNSVEFSDLIKDNSARLATLGGTVSQGTKAFADMSQGFHESGFHEELLQMGMTEKEINSILAEQITTTRRRNQVEGTERLQQMEAARSLAYEMDAMAKLTGKSRSEQEKTLKDSMAKAEVRAAIDNLIARGGEGAERAFKSVALVAGQVGPEMSELVKGVVAAGRLPANATVEQQRMYALLGDESRKLLQQANDAVKRGQHEEAGRLTQQALLAAGRSKEVETAREIGAVGNTELATMYNQFAEFNKRTNRVVEDMRAAGEDTTDIALMNKRINEMVKKEQQERSGVTATIVGAEDQMRKFGAASAGVIETLNEKLGPGFLKFYNEFLKPEARTTGREHLPRPVVQKPEEPYVRPDAVEQARKEKPDMKLPPRVESMLKGEDPQTAQRAITDFFTKGIDIPYAMLKVAGNVILGGPAAAFEGFPDRDLGTFGKTGLMTEPTDFFGKVAKGETVLTPKQLENLVQGSGLTGMMSQMQTMKLPSNVNFTTEISSALKDVTSTLSNPQQSIPADVAAVSNNFKQSIKEESARPATMARESSLNDVVASLDKLNTKISQLNDNILDIGSKQIRAVKSNNMNLYERA